MAPLDTPLSANRFVRHWRPSLLLIAEGEIWPNILSKTHQQGANILLINGRMTDSSLRSWARWDASAHKVFSYFDALIASDLRTQEGLTEIANREVELSGNLKSALPPPACDAQELTKMRNMLGERVVLLAASTHQGEEALVLDALNQIEKPPLLIIAPRHPERGDWVEELLNCTQLKFARRSDEQDLRADLDVYLADTIGEMGLWYRLADTVYLGGGHAPGVGGHNPLEALRLGKPVMTGPSLFNFDDMAQGLQAHGALHIVDDSKAIAENYRLPAPTPDLVQTLEDESFRPMERTLDIIDRVMKAKASS